MPHLNRRRPTARPEPPSPTSQWVGWGVYAAIALGGFVFGVWVGNQRPATSIETVKASPKDETPPDKPPKPPEKAAEPNDKVGKKDAPPTTPGKKDKEPTEPKPGPEPKKPPQAKTPDAKPPATKKDRPPPGREVSFAKEIQPIFKSKCLLCHGDTTGPPKGGLDLRTLAGIDKGGDTGKALIAGNLKESSIWKWIDEGEMPPAKSPQLSDVEKNLIKEWVMNPVK